MDTSERYPRDTFKRPALTSYSIPAAVRGTPLPVGAVNREAFSWLEFRLESFLRADRGSVVYGERRDVIAGLLQNAAGEPVVMTNVTAVLNWIESVVWAVPYVPEDSSSVSMVQKLGTVREAEVEDNSRERKCTELRRNGLTIVNPATRVHGIYFKNETHQSASIYNKEVSVALYLNNTRSGVILGVIQYLTDQFAVTTAEVSDNCTKGGSSCVTVHEYQVTRVHIHPSYAGGRDYNVALLETTPAVEFFSCLPMEPSSRLYYSGKKLPQDAILASSSTWIEFDLDDYVPTVRGDAVFGDRRDEIVGLLQNPSGEALVMTNLTAVQDWIDSVVVWG